MRLINPLIILKILTTILFIETVSFILCLPVALIYSEPVLPFIYSAIITLILAVSLYFLTRKCDLEKAGVRDGYISVSLSWLLFSILGTLPYLFSGTIQTFINAFFESASGFTTTGSTIFHDIEALPYSILFWRSLTHWIGGLGIIVLVVLVLPAFRFTGYHLMSLESSMHERIHPKTRAIGFRLMFIYLGITAAEIIFLSLGDMNLFDSICHTFGTVATGGFSTKNLGIAAFSSYTQYVIMIFMFLSGISFVAYYYVIKLNFKKVKQHEELWFYFATVLIAGAVATFILIAKTNHPFEAAFREGFFNVISIITTTGFANSDFLLWPQTGLLLIFLLLFTGACTGSTTGSIKMARHLIVLRNIKNVFIKITHSNAVYQIKLNRNVLSWNTNVSIISFVVLYLLISVIGTILLTILGTDPLTSASATAVSFGNIGPGLGSLGPMHNYSHLPGLSKIVLSLLMILGRLEIFTIFVIFTRSFWKN
jgi:trk system potassium uptake protein TrkH